MKNFMFYAEKYDGTFIVESYISKSKAVKLYKESLKSLGDTVKGTGWEYMSSPLMLSQQIKIEKSA